jgi:hypothetical protein
VNRTRPIDSFDPDAPNEITAFETRVDSSSLKDNEWVQFDFDPLDSAGKRYRLELRSPEGRPGNAVTVWTNATANGVYRKGDETRQGALAFEAFCAPRGN